MRILTGIKMLWSAIRLTRDPNRLDEVFVIADKLAQEDTAMVDVMIDHARKSTVGALALRERPRLGVLPLAKLREMPEGTLGREFASFLDQRGLDPASLPQRVASEERSYLLAHLYETHDLWHTVTGFHTDVEGELGLQAFYAAQIQGKLPLALLAIGLLNTLLYAFGERMNRMDAIVRGFQMGRSAAPFFGVRWAEKLEQPLSEVRRELGIVSGQDDVGVTALARVAA